MRSSLNGGRWKVGLSAAIGQVLRNVGGGAAAASGEPGQDTTSTTIDVCTEYG